MEISSNFSKGFTDDDDEEEDFGRRENSFQKGLTVRVDGKSNCEPKAITPRSKHSVTEQRRRSKINDRFQILRDLIPHSDQKRDKASFLLEVIEYIQFLQERVQSYESACPGWNEENAKLMPWVKVLFRSFWEKARKKHAAAVEGLSDHSQVTTNGPDTSGLIFSVGDTLPAVPSVLANDQNPAEYENTCSGLSSKANTVPVRLQSYGSQPHQRLISDPQNMTPESQAHWPRSSGGILNDQELTVDEGTINVPSAYSQGLLHSLTQALQSSGVDLSKANISVQITLGKRSLSSTVSNAKDMDDPNAASENQIMGDSRVGSSSEELEQVQKRHKTDRS